MWLSFNLSDFHCILFFPPQTFPYAVRDRYHSDMCAKETLATVLEISI